MSALQMVVSCEGRTYELSLSISFRAMRSREVAQVVVVVGGDR